MLFVADFETILKSYWHTADNINFTQCRVCRLLPSNVALVSVVDVVIATIASITLFWSLMLLQYQQRVDYRVRNIRPSHRD